MVITHHIEWITQNIQAIFNRITKMYELEHEINDVEDADIPDLQVMACPSKILNYQTYQWTIQVFMQLQQVVNKLIDLYNSVNFVDINGYDFTSSIALWISFEKELDEKYYQHLQDNFDEINSLLDQLTSYANENK